MSSKRREQRRKHHREEQRPHDEATVRWSAVLRAIVVGGAATLVVISALVPSEAAVPDGAYAPMAAGWCLLLVLWAASLWLDDQPRILAGWTEAAGSALVGWHSLAAVVWLGHTNGRLALNAQWLVLSYGIGAFLVRQCVRTAAQLRSLVVFMLWLATLLASLGLYQYGYGMPMRRKMYEANPTAALVANGIQADEQSPAREQFENRVRSVEPLATFGLTNSLAGCLAPWLIAALAVAMSLSDWRQERRTLVSLACCAIIVACCLALTKSRSAYLATIAGVVLLALYGRRRGWSLDWRVPAGLAGAALVIGLGAIYLGGLDLEVLSEAPKSVLYRLEYWQATARLIADHPLFGCGPGNFQEAYAAYKLPQASETVADPHNFLLEMWATAGTPAVVFLLALLAGFMVDVAVMVVAGRRSMEVEAEEVAPAAWIVFGGATLGLIAGPMVSASMGYSLADTLGGSSEIPVVWLLSAVLLPAAWWSFGRWIKQGTVTLATLVVPQIVLLIHLLAAGALAFPGVVSTLVVLAPLALNWSRWCGQGIFAAALEGDLGREKSPLWKLPKSAAAAIFVGCALIAGACLSTEYYPVIGRRMALADALFALDQKRFPEAEPNTIKAARADSLSPEPWRLLTELRLEQWRATDKAEDWQTFVESANMFRTLDPRSHLAWNMRGTWFLTAYKKSNRREDLDEALAAFQKASERFPSRALYHAQVAWTLHLAGRDAEAKQAAERAWQLDQQMPHQEQKLRRRHVVDPDISRENPRMELEETAEQTVDRLRTLAAGATGGPAAGTPSAPAGETAGAPSDK